MESKYYVPTGDRSGRATKIKEETFKDLWKSYNDYKEIEEHRIAEQGKILFLYTYKGNKTVLLIRAMEV